MHKCMSALVQPHRSRSATQLRPAAGVCALARARVLGVEGLLAAWLAGWRRQTGAGWIKGSAPVSDKRWIRAVIWP